MSKLYLTEYEFFDVRRAINHFNNVPLYSQRTVAEEVVTLIGAIYDKARTRALHETKEEDKFKSKP